jgi:hypothetical protein
MPCTRTKWCCCCNRFPTCLALSSYYSRICDQDIIFPTRGHLQQYQPSLNSSQLNFNLSIATSTSQTEDQVLPPLLLPKPSNPSEPWITSYSWSYLSSSVMVSIKITYFLSFPASIPKTAQSHEQ